MKQIHEYTSYEELLSDLKEKYGVPTGSYFVNDVSYNPRKNIKRSKEGLFIHHDKEDTVIMLSNPEESKKHNYPFLYHTPEYLTYCNLLEHLMLHVLIATRKSIVINTELRQETGIGGIVTFIAPQINTHLSGAYTYKALWLTTALAIFDNPDNIESYYLCLEYLVKNYQGIMFHNKEILISSLTLADKLVDYEQEKMVAFRINLLARLNKVI